MQVRDIKGLTQKESIIIKCLCHAMNPQKTKNGKDYLTFNAQDETGIVVCNDWDYSGGVSVPPVGVYTLEGVADQYNNKPQLNVKKMTYMPDESGDMYTVCVLDLQQLYLYVEKAKQLVMNIKNNELRDITWRILRDFGLYSDRPEGTPIYGTGALGYHHAGRGGWLKHSVDVAIKANYSAMGCDTSVNVDLVIAGALLHDIGKLHTYELGSMGNYEMSARGTSIEHLCIGTHLLYNYETDDNLGYIIALQNIIASHHGRPEFGNVKSAMFIESLIVSQADELDSKQDMLITKQLEMPEHTGAFKLGLAEYMLGFNGVKHLLTGMNTRSRSEKYYTKSFIENNIKSLPQYVEGEEESRIDAGIFNMG